MSTFARFADGLHKEVIPRHKKNLPIHIATGSGDAPHI